MLVGRFCLIRESWNSGRGGGREQMSLREVILVVDLAESFKIVEVVVVRK